MAYDAGTAWLQVIPSFENIQALFSKEAEKLGRQMDDALSKGTVQGMQKAGREAQKEGAKAGNNYAGAFSDAVHKKLDSAIKSSADVEPNLRMSKFDRQLAVLREKLATLGDAHVDAKISNKTFIAQIRAMASELRKLERDAPNVGSFFNANAMRKELEGILDIAQKAREAGFRAGNNFGGAFAEEARARIDAGLKSLPKIHLDGDSSDFDKALVRIQNEMKAIRGQIGVELNDAQALAAIKKLEAELDAMIARTKDITVKYNLEKARDNLKSFADDVAPEQGRNAGDKAGGAFQDAFSKHLTGASSKIPDIEIGADTSDADVSIAAVKREIAELSGKTIGVNVDEGDAVAKLVDLKRRLDELSRNDASLKVRTDAAEASRELTEILILAGVVDRANPTVKVDATGTSSVSEALRTVINESGVGSSRLVALITIGASIGSIIAPAAAAAAVAISGIGTAAAAAASGVGVAILGFSGIGGAVQALDKFQKDSSKSAASLSKAQNSVARSVDGVASAERSLENTRASGASAARRASQAVVEAKRGEIDAAKDVVNAQKSVIDAQRSAQRAQEDLTRAYRDARRESEDQALALKDVALAQRQGVLDVAEAKKKLDAVIANPRSTNEDREQAKITYEQRVLQLQELGIRQQRLTADKAESDKKGVEGSDKVRSAQDKVRSATDGVAKAQDRVVAAQEGVIKAQQRTADAIEAQRDQARQAQFQIEQGQAAVTNAMRAAENASTSAGVAGGAAMENLKDAMDALGPAGQRFAKFLYGLKPVFLDIRNVAQAGLLPGVEEGIRRLLPYVSSFKDFVGRVAAGLSRIFQNVISALEKPTWKAFFSYISDTAVPALEGMFEFAENIARGLAALVLALSPFNADMGKGLIGMSEAFARWAESLSRSQGFQKFLAYVKENGPRVVDLIEQLGLFVIRFVIAAAPVGERVLRIFQAIFDWINSWPLASLSKLIGLIAFLATVILGITAITKAYLTVAGLVKAVQAAWAKGADLAGRAQKRFRGEIESTNKAQQGLSFGLGYVDQQSTRAASSTGRLTGALGRLRQAMVGISDAQYRGLSKIETATGTAARTATSAIGTGVKNATGVVSSGMQSALSRYTASITTAQGQVGLLAKTQETASRVMVTAMDRASLTVSRYTAAVTTAEGRVGLFAKSQEVLGRGLTAVNNAVGTQQARYMTALTVQEGAARAWQSTQEKVTSAASTTWARMGAATTVHLDRVQSGVATAGTKIKQFGSSMGNTIATGAGKAVRGLGGLADMFGGPLGIAMIGAGLAIDHYREKQQKADASSDETKGALGRIADAYAEGGQAAVDSLAATDEAVRKTTTSLNEYGVASSTVFRAQQGDVGSQDTVLQALAARRTALQNEFEQLQENASLWDVIFGDEKLVNKRGGDIQDESDALDKLIPKMKEEWAQRKAVNQATKEAAANGSLYRAQVGNIINTMADGRATADEYKAAIGDIGTVSVDTATKAALYSTMADRVSASQLNGAQKAALFGDILKGLGSSAETSGPVFDALAGTFSNIATSSLNARDKVSLLQQAMDQMYGSAQAQIDAEENLVLTQERLSTQLANNSAGFDLETAKRGVNRQAIVDNRNALEESLKTAQDVYVQDVANNMEMGRAKEKHDTLTKSILDQIPPNQRNSASVQEIVNKWGQVPPTKNTTVTTPGLPEAIGKLIEAQAVNKALSMKPPGDRRFIEEEIRFLTLSVEGRKASWADKLASGGQVGGWSPHKRADNIPAWLTAREFVQPVDSVNYYGVPFMEALRTRSIPKEILGFGRGGGVPRFADGGLGRWPIEVTASFDSPDIPALWKQWEAAQFSGTFGNWPPSPAAQRGDSGVWHQIVALIKSTGPLSGTFGNSYRAGDPLWHGSGRAVDWMGYGQDALASFLAARNPLELIHRTNSRDYAYTRGRNMGSFNQALMDAHRNHIHAAFGGGGLVPKLYDSGGFLKPGWNPPIFNGTGRPEPVLTSSQWGSISQIAANGTQAGPSNVNNWYFRDTTLDPAKLQAIENRQAALARVGRAV